MSHRDFFAFIEDTFKVCVKACEEEYDTRDFLASKIPVESVQISPIKTFTHEKHK